MKNFYIDDLNTIVVYVTESYNIEKGVVIKNFSDSYENALRKIKESEKCRLQCSSCVVIGSTGPTGPTGPTGSIETSTTCFCVDQMRNVIKQLIELYPDDNVIIAMESGNNASGRLGSLLPAPNDNPNAGLLQLTNSQGTPEEAISLCRIASITITSSTYNDSITYLSTPEPLPTGCDTNCENASRTYLPVGTENVGINAGGQTVATGDVIRSEYGMVVLAGTNNSNPSFVSLCKAEIITK